MKKTLFVGLIVISLLFISFVVNAAPVGNIAKPAMLKSVFFNQGEEKPVLGFIGEGEFDITDNVNIQGCSNDTEFESLGGKLGLVLLDRIILYGSLGTAVFNAEFDSNGRNVRIESDVGTSWGFGGTAIAYEKMLPGFDNSILRIGVDGRFRVTDLKVESIVEDTTTYYPDNADINGEGLSYWDWQVALAASLQLGILENFIPYAGVKYSNCEADATTEVGPRVHHLLDAESEDNLGIFVGTDIVIADYLSVNIEGRFIDEEAVSFGAAVRF